MILGHSLNEKWGMVVTLSFENYFERECEWNGKYSGSSRDYYLYSMH
jgi:hypothetical protein